MVGQANSFIIKKLSKTDIALFFVLVMLVGFLLSRSLLSAGMAGFGATALWNVHPKNWLRDKWWLWGISWVAMYAISGLWSSDAGNWHTRVEVKLAILLLPLSFTLLPAFTAKQLRRFALIASVLFLCSAAYSLFFYFKDPVYYSEQYVYSHILPTLVYGDHIRYSLAVALFIVWCVYIWPQLLYRWLQVFVAITVILLSVYLHILAARSGLLVWYLFLVLFCFRLVFTKKPLIGLALLIMLVAAGFFAGRYVPTLEKRVWYVKETYRQYQSGVATSGLSDMGRLISYRLAIDIIKAHPFTGVGAGDMQQEMEKEYIAKYPLVPAEYRLIPHNQFLIVCLGCGIPALILFMIWAFFPVAWGRGSKGRFFLMVTWLSLLLALMVEPMLEVQFGVFVFLFFLLWQRHTLTIAPPPAVAP